MNELSLDNLQTAVTTALKSWGKTLDAETESLQQLLLVQNQLEQVTDPLPIALRHAIDQVLLDGLDLLAEQDEMGAKVLNGRFIDNLITRDVAHQLHASPDQVNRWQRSALAQLTQLLWRQEQTLRQSRITELEVNLPAATYNKLFGLQADRESVIGRLLSSDTPWLMAITGIGGIGKTSLADDVVRAVLPTLTFQHIAWVRVESLPPAEAFERAIGNLMAQLWPEQISHELLPEQLRRLRQACQSQPHLIVIDNLETEAQMTYFGEKLLPLTNPSRFLLTSKARMGGTTAVYTHSLHELSLPDVTALVRDQAAAIGLPELAQADDDAIADLYTVVGGNPLALKQVVSLAAAQPLPQVLSNFAHKPVGPIEALYRHIYWEAWGTLSPEAQTLLQAMPQVATAGASPEQMQAMSGLKKDVFWTAMQELITHSLLDIQGDIKERHYNIHRLTKTFLHTEIVSAGERPSDEAASAQPLPKPITPSALQEEKRAPSATRRKQRILLKKVKHFWVDGVLAKSVQNGVLLDLEQRWQDMAVAQPWVAVMGTAVTPLQSHQTQKSLHDIFRATDRALLILGAPGSGKTTSLITLARDLIAQAEAHENTPIPIILNLASWAEKRTAVADWIIEELTAKYQVPRTIGREWLDDDMLLPLLDGLDEVPAAYQVTCIKALNQYREMHGLKGIVVCCRADTYEALQTPLKLGGAIQLQPLTSAQIEAYLAVGGAALQPLRMAIQQDERLRELAYSPLTLSVMSSLYQGDGRSQPDAVIDELDDVPHEPQHLFAVYLQRMYERRGSFRYAPAPTTHWLSWLAAQMSAHNQAMFLIEKMQPAWLPQRRWRWLYLLGSRLGDSLFIGLFLWLYWLMTLQARPDFELDWSGQLLSWLPVAPVLRDLAASLLRTAVVGLLVALVDIFLYEQRLDGQPLTNRAVWGETAVVGLTATLTATLIMLISHHNALAALAFGVANGVIFMLFAYYVHGHHYQGDIRTVEALGWSWSGAFKSIVVGLVVTVLIELFEWLLYGPTAFLQTSLMACTTFFLLGGLSGKQVPTTTRPNQGIWLSLRNSVLVALVLGIPLTVLGTVLWHLSYGLIGGLLIGMVSGTLVGGRNVANHYYLRFLLWVQGCLPWQYARFLDETADRIILRKVGGGYIFIHRLLQDYFDSNR